MSTKVADTAAGMSRGVIEGIDGVVLVRIDGDRTVACATLEAPSVAAPLRAGDPVVVLLDEGRETGVVMGRVRPAVPDGAPREGSESPTPDTLLLEASREITLKVGDGSITIRKDGKILIKGRDLVSHATRRNRIRGGSVDIN